MAVGVTKQTLLAVVQSLFNTVVLYTTNINAIADTTVVVSLMTDVGVMVANIHGFLSECVQWAAGSFAAEASQPCRNVITQVTWIFRQVVHAYITCGEETRNISIKRFDTIKHSEPDWLTCTCVTVWRII